MHTLTHYKLKAVLGYVDRLIDPLVLLEISQGCTGAGVRVQQPEYYFHQGWEKNGINKYVLYIHECTSVPGGVGQAHMHSDI